jgi:serine/threonine-protein kinase
VLHSPDAAAAVPDTVPKKPEVIGRFQIVDQIGQGGMGSLFLAWDPLLERQIAIKLLRDDSEELRQRFAREARSVARLRHHNIVTIFDVGEQDGQPFIAMEYIQGQTLAELIRGGARMPLARKLQLIEALCDGLGFAHKADIVHRDVKPANVMVERDGVLKILDFGIARIAESGMTQAGMLIGTLNYMSPEQVAGHVVDGRSDIFAVGAVLYELLSCRQAFPGGLQNGILNRILNEAPPPLSDLCPGIDPDIIEIVARALAKKPEDRYQDLASMRRDLEAARRLVETAPATSGSGDAETLALRDSAVPTPRTPRRGTDREDLARRRAAQVALHVEDAQRAINALDFDAAIAAAEQALLLDAEEPTAGDILERARIGLAERQLPDLLRRGGELLQAGSLTDAQVIADEAMTLVPGSTEALAFRDSVRRAHRDREREAERAKAVRAAIDRARVFIRDGVYEQAEAAAAEVLRLDAQSAEGQALQQQARDGLLARRASAAVREANRLFARGSHDEAFALLRGFEPAHELTASALAQLERDLEQLERERREAQQQEEARRAREREAASVAALARAEKTAGHAAAISILEQALAVDAAHAGLQAALASRRDALRREEAAEREARARAEKIAAALTAAERAGSHQAAVEILDAALRQEPGHVDLTNQLAARRAALAQEQEEARRREREAASAAALGQAEQTAGHAAAIRILKQALAADATHGGLLAALSARETALRQQEAAEQEARARAQAIAAALTRARELTAHAAAIDVLEEALRLEPGHADVTKQLAARRQALAREQEDARRAREREAASAAALAQAEKSAGHAAAIKILKRALAADAAHAGLQAALEARESALRQEEAARREARARAEKISAALIAAERARSHQEAVTVLEEALRLEPGHAQVTEQLTARRAALAKEQEEARRARERAAASAAALAEAEKTAGHAAAITMLKRALAADAAHPGLQAALATREDALRQEEAAEREARARAQKITAALTAAEQARSHQDAVKILDEALGLEPGHPQVTRALAERRTALAREEEAARQAREREAASAAALAQAEKTTGHAAAIKILKLALATDPAHPRLQAALAAREELLRQQEVAEREKAIASAIARAEQAQSHPSAISILEGALALDASRADVRQRLAERRAAHQQALEQERLDRERAEASAAAVKRARRTKSDDAAVALLTEALARDPGHQELRAQLETRQAALDRVRAETARREELESAKRTILHLIAQGQYDAAAAALNQAEQTFPTGRPFRDISRRLAQARDEAERRAAGLGPRSQFKPAYAVAASVAVVALGSLLYFRSPSNTADPSTTGEGAGVAAPATPADTPVQSEPASSSQTVDSAPSGANGAAASSDAPPPGQPPEPTPESKAAAAVPVPSAVAARNPAPDPRLAAAIANARRQMASGDLRQALSTALAIDENPARDSPLTAVYVDIVASARRMAVAARASAVRAGDASTFAAFRDGESQVAQARRFEQAGRRGRAAAALLDAADSFERAEGDARESAASAAAAAAAAARATPPPQAPARSSGPPPAPAPVPASAPPAAVNTPAPSPAASSSPPPAAAQAPVSTTPAASSRAADEAGIRVALRAYETAYSALDVDAVRRIYPTVNAAALAQSFRALESQEVRITEETITISGAMANVRARVRQSFTPKVGSGRADVFTSDFRLQKVDDRWVILERR